MDEQVKPAEWVLVPREPTEEMIAAAVHKLGLPWREIQRLMEGYRIMVAASPSPEGTRADAINAAWDRAMAKIDPAVRDLIAAPLGVIASELLRSAEALTLPPVPGVDREVVARLENDLAQGWISNARTAADIRAILALVSPLEGKGSTGTH